MTDAGLIAAGRPRRAVRATSADRRCSRAPVHRRRARRSPSGCRAPGRCSTCRPTATASRSASARRCCAATPACCRPTTSPSTVARCASRFAGVYALVEGAGDDHGLPTVRHADAPAARADDRRPFRRSIPAGRRAACCTSGSTGEPVPHAKPWGLLIRNARAEAQRLAAALGRATSPASPLVATVPAQHMYGFESTRADRAARRRRVSTPSGRSSRPTSPPRSRARRAPRVLVTTPFHLKTVLDAGPRAAAARPRRCARPRRLSPQLAARAEAAPGAPLLEIYGCTEAGQVATRRTTAGAEWRTLRRRAPRRRRRPRPSAAATCRSRPCSPTCSRSIDAAAFRLLGRSNDLINVAGKRSSLGHLNYHLNSIEGVVDGAFWMPPDERRRRGRRRPPGRVRGRAGRPQRERHRRGAARRASTRRSCRAASFTSMRCRARRPASCAARALGRAGRRACSRPASDERASSLPHSVEIAADHPAVRRPLPRPAGAARRRPRSPRCSKRRCASRRCAACVGTAPRLAVRQVPRAGAARAHRCDRRSPRQHGARLARRRRPRRDVASGQIARADIGRGAPP